ncbi:MAG TPA: cobalamin-dependent protein [Gemmatimonadaceae bacterium]|nr:cobalamin-dependent protein [Gemmatimonadaceae bacterium]
MEDSTPRHPIAVASERTGLSQDLLRIWERRYEAVEPTRGPGGHRTYSDADIARLRLLHAVTSAGRSIGQVARLSTSELTRMAEEDKAARAERGMASGARESRDAGSHAAAQIVEMALASTARLDASDLEHSLRRAIARLGITSFIEDVASPILRRIGEEWHVGRLTIAHEHLASSTIHDIVAESMRAIGRGTGDATVLVATPTGERHAIGAALVGATAASEGWRVVYLGTDLPASDIAAAAIATKARAIAMSVIYVQDRARTLGELRTLRALIPPSIAIIVGGAGAAEMEDDLRQLGIRVGASLRDLRGALASVNDAIDSGAARPVDR